MGCPECADTAIEGAELARICRTANTEAECEQANPGGPGTFKSGSLPAEVTRAAVSSDTSAACMASVPGASVLVVSAVLVATVLPAYLMLLL
jgi:hypothetical protein